MSPCTQENADDLRSSCRKRYAKPRTLAADSLLGGLSPLFSTGSSLEKSEDPGSRTKIRITPDEKNQQSAS
jgi:hypothetical protein